MFGYIIPNLSAMTEERKVRYRAIYCGLCHALRDRHGLIGTVTLSNDLTFLALLLNSLYEGEEVHGSERCIPHPVKRHDYIVGDSFEYVADMNVALAYHKCIDNWLDDKNLLSRGGAAALQRAYGRIFERYPEKCAAIEAWLEEIHRIESSKKAEIDLPVNSTGRLLGELFCWKDDYWSGSLRTIGDGLGRFIYMMDAYDDLPEDERKNRFNPLIPYRNDPNFEDMCKDAMLMMVADSTREFEQLPIVQDVDLLRNVLYSGIWSKYTRIKQKKEEGRKGA